MAPKENETKMVKDVCSVCGKEFEYADRGWKPHTCGSFDCVQKYFVKGSKINKDAGVFQPESAKK
jgi:hypothetical protein